MMPGLRSLSLLLLLALAPAYSTPPGSPCSRPAGETSTCVCQTPDGVVDLRGAASDNGVARYKGMEDPNNFVYEYNPCFPFSTVGECSNVHLCQESKDIPPSTYKIADAGTEQIFLDTSTGQNVLTVFYTSQDGFGTYREVNVHLECDKSVKDPVVMTTGDSIAVFTYDVSFRSCYACPGGCGEKVTTATECGTAPTIVGGGTLSGIVGLIVVILPMHLLKRARGRNP